MNKQLHYMPLKKKKGELVPGTVIECKSGRYVAFYEHRTDIIANGENETGARKNLRKMYEIVRKHEEKAAMYSLCGVLTLLYLPMV